MSSYCKCSNRY